MIQYEWVKCDSFCDDSANLGHGKITDEYKIFSELFLHDSFRFLPVLLKYIECKVFCTIMEIPTEIKLKQKMEWNVPEQD